MLGKRLSIIILVILWASPAFAETLWVRPPNSGCANNGNGGAYGCAASPGAEGAWIGWENIVWGSGSNELGPGDTLKFCDLWDYNEGDFGYLGESDHLIMQGGGTDAENIITVDFGDATYPGAILGSLYVEGSECSDNADGTYTFDSNYAASPSQMAYGDDYTSATPLYKSDSTPPADGYFYYDVATEEITFNPVGEVAYESLERAYYKWRGSFFIDGYDYITINEIKIYFMSDSHPAIELSDYNVTGREPNNVIVTGGTFRYTGGEFINCRRSSSSYITLSYNYFKYFQQVTYPNYNYGGVAQNHTYWHVHHNTVDGVSQSHRVSQGDGHVLGGQNLSDGVWEYNNLINIEGDAFLNYAGGTISKANNNVFRYNQIYYSPDADSLGMYGRAFDVNGTLADNLDEITKEIFIHNNIIVGALIGFRTKSGYDPTSETYNKVHNNTFINCKRVVELISPNHDDTTTCGNGVDFRGNIVENSTVDNIYSDNHSDSYLFIICDNNIWHSSSTPVWTLDGVECDDYADWKSDFNSFFGYDADANSLTGDPLLVGAGTYDEDTDVKFPTNSPAKDNGADLTPTDYFGTSRPQGEGDDIGAFELPVEGSPEDTYTIGVSLTGTGCR